MLKEKFEITTDIIGHEGESKKQITVLNRFISLKDRGYTDERDVRDLGLQGAKALSTPVSDMHHERKELQDHAKFKKISSCALERTQVPGRARDADGLQRCKLGKQCIGQTEHQRWSSRARVNRTPSHVTFSRVCPHSFLCLTRHWLKV